ncbi:MAG: 1-deoxy-D-xylulose-5-phosphate synthase [Oscillospiraceae bacterium]|nr:1-deoxy-D-xylulose-5-phosphate synthase [Oscillospiraceae bacterium]
MWEYLNGLSLPLYDLTDSQGVELCRQLRKDLVQSVSQTGGHLASNLGDVELTVAIHRAYDTTKDRLVFDVGHQCYIHKILTGRAGRMDTMRKFGGLAGFPKPSESVHDAFIAGHASDSVSVAVGMARARTIMGENYDVIALIGDGALTGGLSYEGLSDAGGSGERMVVIVNDNGMSIKKNVGGISKLLGRHHLKPAYLQFKQFYRSFTNKLPGGKKLYTVTHKVKKAIKGTLLPSSMFEDLGFTYIGPVDGHNLSELTRLLKFAKEIDGPVLLHVRTIKGKGYPPAEKTPANFHGVTPFHVEDGSPVKKSGDNFSAVMGRTLCRLGEETPNLCAVTAAMESGTGLTGFAERFPKRFFDVGIAEGHAVSMCAGMAKQGVVPVFAVYSTFLQRSYDMLIHDVAIQKLHVVFCVDRAGLVGEDGETHQGTYDISMLATVPNMVVLAPASFQELDAMLTWAVKEATGPVAVRYPRGGENGFSDDTSKHPTVVLREGNDMTLVTYGTMIGEAIKAADLLAEKGISCEVIKLNRVSPVDTGPVLDSVKKTHRLTVAEEVASRGSVGRDLATHLAALNVKLDRVRLLNAGDGLVTHGSVDQLRNLLGIDAQHIAATIEEAVR